MAPRFTRARSEAVFSTGWVTVTRHTLDDATHAVAERTVLTFDMADWVNVIARTPDGAVVFVRQHRFGTDADSLEIPGGIIDPGESPAHAAARELREETGYVATSWRAAGVCHANPAIQANRVHTFIAEGCVRAGPPELDALEDCRVELIPERELPARIARREITHALVLVALFEFILASRDA